MKNKMKRALLLLACLSTFVFGKAATAFVKGGIGYEITSTGSTLTVSVVNRAFNDDPGTWDWQNMKYKGKVTIPKTVKWNDRTWTVTGISADAFKYGTAMTELVIPNTITSVSSTAFTNATKLATLTIADGNNTLTLYPKTFDTCPITNFYIGRTIETNPLYEGVFTGSVQIKKLEGKISILPCEWFRNSTNLKSIDIPDGVKRIGADAFAGCTALESVNIAPSVTEIGQWAFYGCTSLRSVYIQKGDTELSLDSHRMTENCTLRYLYLGRNTDVWGATTYCSLFNYALKEIHIADNVTKLPRELFENCEFLREIHVYWTDPIAFNRSFSSNVNEDAVLYVPGGTVNKYKNTMPWSLIKNIVPTAIGLTIMASDGGSVRLNNDVVSGGSKLVQVKPDWILTFEVEAEEGYSFKSITMNGEDVTSQMEGNTLTITGVQEDFTVSVCFQPTIIEMDKEPQTLEMTSLPTMTYGDVAYTLPTTTTEGQILSWTSSNAEIATIVGDKLKIVGAGTATVTATQAGNDSYQPFLREFTLTVNKAALTITADNKTKQEGEENPELTVSYSGFVNGDNSSSLTTQPIVTTTATTTSPAGTYPITVSGAVSNNYELTYVDGVMTVTEKPSVIEVTDISQMENVIYIEPTTELVGTTIDLCVKMKNVLVPVGCSFKLTLPEGLRLKKDEDGDVVYELGSRTKKMSLTRQDWNNGTYDFALTPSTSTATISGSDDVIVTFKLPIPDDMAAGDYALKLTKCLIQSKANGTTTDYPLNDVVTTLTVEDYVTGDVNGDRKVTPSDAIMILYHYFDVEQTGFNVKAADVNGDGSVTPADAIETLYIYFNDGSQSNARQMQQTLDPQ